MTITATRTPLAVPTRASLASGALSGPLYFLISLTQAAFRDGFDLAKHPASMLSDGDAGWIQVTNFLDTGVLMIASCRAEPGNGFPVRADAGHGRRQESRVDPQRGRRARRMPVPADASPSTQRVKT